MSNKILTKENVPFIFGTVCAIAGLLFGISAIDKYIESKTQPAPTETEPTEVIPVATETLTESQVEVIQLEVSSAAAAGQAVADLQNQLTMAQLAASQNAQTATIQAGQRALANEVEQYVLPTPRPCYVVPNPNCCGQNYYGCGVA